MDIMSKIYIVHYIADFLLQTRWMGENKSTKNIALLAHIFVYTAVMGLFGIKYAVVNGVIHLVVDYISSRVGGYYYKKGNLYMFWAIIGLDQLIHILTLKHTLFLL